MGNCITPSRQSVLKKVWVKKNTGRTREEIVSTNESLKDSDSSEDESDEDEIVVDIKEVLCQIDRGSLAKLISVRTMDPIREESSIDLAEFKDEVPPGTYDTDCGSDIGDLPTHNRLGKFDSACGSANCLQDEYESELYRLDRELLERMGARWYYGTGPLFIDFEDSLNYVVEMSPLSPVSSFTSSMYTSDSSDFEDIN